MPPGFRNWDRHVPGYIGKFRKFSPVWNRTVHRQEQGLSYIWADGDGGYVRRDGTPVFVWPPDALDHINWFIDAFDQAEEHSVNQAIHFGKAKSPPLTTILCLPGQGLSSGHLGHGGRGLDAAQ